MWGYGVVSDTTAYHFKAVVCITSLALASVATDKPRIVSPTTLQTGLMVPNLPYTLFCTAD